MSCFLKCQHIVRQTVPENVQQLLANVVSCVRDLIIRVEVVIKRNATKVCSLPRTGSYVENITYLKIGCKQVLHTRCPQGVICTGSRSAIRQIGHSNALSRGVANFTSYPGMIFVSFLYGTCKRLPARSTKFTFKTQKRLFTETTGKGSFQDRYATEKGKYPA